MKSVVFEGPKKLAIADLPDPSPRRGEILLKVLYCGICETDSFVYRTGQFAVPGIVLGHMGGGEILETGPGVVGWKIGDRVAVDPRVYCGECLACRGGHSTMCQKRLEAKLGVWIGINAYRDERREQLYHGMLAEYCVVPDYSCYPIPDSINDEMSAAVEGTAYSVRCIRKSGVRLGDDTVLFGAADYCLEWMQWAKHVGARRVIVVEPIQTRREMAQRLGADAALDPTSGDIEAELHRLLPFGADVVAIYPTYPGSMRTACEIIKPRGNIQLLICYEEENMHGTIPLVAVMKELQICHPGLFEAEPWRGGRVRGDYALAIELLAKKTIDVQSYVTRIIPWEEVDRIAELAFERLPEKEVKVRVRIGGK
jgi:(R,R)-butanediol dehydrogenase / meso-butanediol dehydrogenase / diacetyl reductase